MTTQDEADQVLDARAIEAAEKFRLHRFGRFVNAGFSFEQAEKLERGGADYHFADQLHAAGCTPELAMRILS